MYNEQNQHVVMLPENEERIIGRPFGYGRPYYGRPYGFGYGAPFVGGVLGGLLGSALIRPYGFYGSPYYPYGYGYGYGYPYYPFY